MTPVQRGTRLLIALVLVITTSACVGMRLAYNNLDWLASWQIERYFDMEDAQEALLKERFPVLWQWHRKTQLALYAADLRALAADAAQPMSRAQIEDYRQRLRAHFSLLWTELRPSVADMLQTLNAEQVKSLKGKIQKDWDEEAEQRRDPIAKRLERAREGLEESLERWAGSLNDGQRGMVKAWNEMYGLELEVPRLEAYRKNWLQAFDALLADRAAADFAARFEAFSVDPPVVDHDWFLQRREVYRAHTTDLMVALAPTMTPKQRQHLQEEVLDLAGDLQHLADR